MWTSKRKRFGLFLVVGSYAVMFGGLFSTALLTEKTPAAEENPAVTEPLAITPELRAKCLDILRKGMHSDEFWPSMHAAEALSLAGRGADVQEFLGPKVKTETDDQHRCGLAREMARAGDRSKVAVMLEILAKKDPYGHVSAAESLYKVAGIGDGRLLRQALTRQENTTLRLMAAAALGRCGSPAAMKFLREKLTDEDPEVSRLAAWVLGRIGDAADVPQLQRNVKRAEDPLTRCYNQHALAALGDPQGQEALKRNLSDEDSAIRTYAATFAGEIRMSSVADQLTGLLDDEAIDVRIRAAQSLLVLSGPPPADRHEDISRDVYPATKKNPRNSEGSIIALRDGSLLYATTLFIGGRGDASTAQIVARGSSDGGRSWGPSRVLQENVGRRNVMSVTLRRLPKSGQQPAAIGMFYLVKNDMDDLKVYLRISSDEARTFGEPIVVTGEPGYHVTNNDRVTVLSSGRLVAPVSSTADVRKVNHFVSSCWLSDDGGRSWRHGKGKVDFAKRGAMEPEILELTDGRALMIVRTQLGYIAASYSDDGCDTWTEPASWNVKAPEAPATLRRIPATGDLLLVWNHTYVPGAGHGGQRTPLTAAISSDEGRSWTNFRNLEDRKDESYAYTSLVFVRDRALLSYYVAGPAGLSSRLRSLPVAWFYRQPQ